MIFRFVIFCVWIFLVVLVSTFLPFFVLWVPGYSYLTFSISLIIIAVVLGLVCCSPYIIWKIGKNEKWTKGFLFIVIAFLLSVFLFSVPTKLFNVVFTPFTKPPEAATQKYSYEIEGGLGPSVRVEYIFSWDTKNADDVFSKALSTAKFFDEWGSRKKHKVRAFSHDSPPREITCFELASRQVDRYKSDLKNGRLDYNSPQIYIDCEIIAPFPGRINLKIFDHGGTITFW